MFTGSASCVGVRRHREKRHPRRDSKYRNSFLPVVTRRIRDEGDGCIIEIILRLHFFVAVFMALWLGGVTVGAISTLAEVSRGHSAATALIPSGMFVFERMEIRDATSDDMKRILALNNARAEVVNAVQEHWLASMSRQAFALLI